MHDSGIICLQDWQVLSPQLLKNLQLAGVPVDVVQVASGKNTADTHVSRGNHLPGTHFFGHSITAPR